MAQHAALVASEAAHGEPPALHRTQPSQRQLLLALKREREAAAEERTRAVCQQPTQAGAVTASLSPAHTSLAQFAARRKNMAEREEGELAILELDKTLEKEQTELRQRMQRQRTVQADRRDVGGPDGQQRNLAGATGTQQETDLIGKYCLGGSVYEDALAKALVLEQPGTAALKEWCEWEEREEQDEGCLGGCDSRLGSPSAAPEKADFTGRQSTTEYVFTACATGVVLCWAVEKQLQSDQLRVRPHHAVCNVFLLVVSSQLCGGSLAHVA